MFDVCSKLCIALSGAAVLTSKHYEICSELIDLHIDISMLYGQDKKEEVSEKTKDNQTYVKLDVDGTKENAELFVLKEFDSCMCLIFIVKQGNYDRPYFVNENVEKFREGLKRLLNETSKSLT